MKFGDMIRQIRTDFNMRQIDFANDVVEVSRPQVANVERDFCDPSLLWIPMICERLQISIYYDPVIGGWHYERLG